MRQIKKLIKKLFESILLVILFPVQLFSFTLSMIFLLIWYGVYSVQQSLKSVVEKVKRKVRGC